ncbi:MAG: PAS domain S-box protein [Sterolibacterium sp.]|nr:PAS domain S-box protein [Sterolibacterium sp.]
MSKRTDFWLAVVLPIALFSAALGGVGWYAYAAARQMMRQEIAGDMQAIAGLKNDQIQQWLAERRDDAQLISTKRLSLDLREWLKPGGGNRELAGRIVDQLQFPGTAHYRFVSLHSAVDGRQLLPTGIHRESATVRAQVLEAAKLGQPVIEDMHFAEDGNASIIHVGYFSPMRGITREQPLAVIHLSMNPGETLFPLLQKWPGTSRSAETLLLRREGGQVVYLNTLRHFGDSALKLRRDLSTPNFIPARLMAEGDGFFEANDYRGIPSLAYGLRVAGTPWFLVAKIDRAEAYAQLDTIAGYSSLLLGMLLLVFAWWVFERRRAETALTDSFGEIEDLYQNAPCGYHSLDRDGTFIRINDTELKLLGYTREEVIGKKKLQDLLTAESRARFEAIFPRFLAIGQIKDLEIDFVRKDGTLLPQTIVSATALRNGRGEYELSRITLNDLSRYKRAENELRLSEERFRGLFGSIRDAVFVHGLRADGSPDCFVEVNAVACERLGYSRDELLTMTPADIDAPNFQAGIKPSIEQLNANQNLVFERAHVTKHGKSIPVEISASLFMQQGQPMIVSIVRDITERKAAEQKLIGSREQLRQLSIYDDSVREEERKRIAREVHDELGQLLTALRMDIVMLQMRFDEVPGLFDKTEEMLALIESTIGVVRHVTSNLRPPALDSGIVGALEWLAEDFSRRTGIPCAFVCQIPDLALEDALATSLFRIAQESLTNVTRHARARHVSISLINGDGYLRLTVEDDGCGFDPHAAMKARKSFGLLGMHERAAALNGRLSIDSGHGRGTRVLIELPLPGKESP